MLGLALMAAAAAGGPGKCVKDEDTKRFPETQQTAYLLSDKSVTRPGDTIELAARWRDGPFGVKEIPLACLKKWQVDPKQAVLSSDRRTLRFADDVPAGSSVSVSAMFGKSVIRGSFKITGRDEQVLYGTWSEASSTGCGTGARRVAELVFSQRGGYSFTFPDMMVETMTSGGGRYRFDADAGTLELDGDKFAATLDGAMLTLAGKRFDNSVMPEILGVDPKTNMVIKAPEQQCRIVFRRSGG
jgi:hypothetical protein